MDSDSAKVVRSRRDGEAARAAIVAVALDDASTKAHTLFSVERDATNHGVARCPKRNLPPPVASCTRTNKVIPRETRVPSI